MDTLERVNTATSIWKTHAYRHIVHLLAAARQAARKMVGWHGK